MSTIDAAGPDAPDVSDVPELSWVGSHRYTVSPWSGHAYRLARRPGLRVVVEHGDNHTVVRETEVGVFGSGGDIFEAWTDFREAVNDHIGFLERQEALSDDLAHHLRYLRSRAVNVRTSADPPR